MSAYGVTRYFAYSINEVSSSNIMSEFLFYFYVAIKTHLSIDINRVL